MNEIRPGARLSTMVAGLAGFFAALAWAVVPPAPQPAPLAAMLPRGALMTVETADFGALVADWNRSPEQRAWLRSANYSAFANSRLFTRLADAQTGFADAAKTGLDGDFLQQVAGKESIFAWYDIGNLEFLYLSHLPKDQLSRLSLVAQRGSFARREAAGTAFYVRTSVRGSADVSAQDTAGTDADPTADSVRQPRTVAFAVSGEWLVLATREDLVAGALQNMVAPPRNGAKAAPESEANAGWWAAANAASTAPHGDLHMLLDLQALAKTPQFRTYWIQRNVTATRQYRAAVVDLYREPGQFREERVLLPVQPESAATTQPNLAILEGMVPERAGVYRAVATPNAEDALQALQDHVLLRASGKSSADTTSPAAQTEVTPIGAAGDFDTRIDTPAAKTTEPGSEFADLRKLLASDAVIDSMLTVDRSDPPSAQNAFVSIHSAVILRSLTAWNRNALSSALLASLRPRLTTGTLGVDWTDVSSPGGAYLTLGTVNPVCFWTDGPLAIVATDPALMADILARRASSNQPAQPASLVAGFRHDQERRDFRQLTADLNLASESSSGAEPAGANEPTHATPSVVNLFRDNLPGLSDAFGALASEHLVESNNGRVVRQTVLYHWNSGESASLQK